MLKLHKSLLPGVIQEYLVRYHMPKVKSTLTGLVLGLGIVNVEEQVTNMINSNVKFLKNLNIMDDNDNIDIEMIYGSLCKSLAEYNDNTISIPFIKYKDDKDDIDTIYSIAKQYMENATPIIPTNSTTTNTTTTPTKTTGS